jgi:hypothetical protein
MATLKQFKQTLLQSRQKGYKKIEEKNEGYNRSHQKKKIKGKKASVALSFPEQIGYQA